MSQFNATSYDIQRPTGQCAFTGRKLEPGQAYMATLVELDEEQLAQVQDKATAALGMKRVDVSIEAWQQGSRPDNLFSHWKTLVPEPNQKKRLFIDDEVLMNLFTRLEDTEEEEKLSFRFVLGLILMRKKLLKYVSSERDEDGREWWTMQPRGEAAPLTMLNPQMDEDKVGQVTAQLGQILDAEL